MRVLVISQYFWPENFRINDLVEGLLERSHEVTVLTGLPNYPSGKLSPGFGFGGPYKSRFWRRHRHPRSAGTARQRPRHPACPQLLFVRLHGQHPGSWRCKGRYDAILVFEPSPITVGIPARVISWLKGVPILFWVQDLWPESLSATGAVKSPRILEAVAGLVRWIYRGCAKVLVQSEALCSRCWTWASTRTKSTTFRTARRRSTRPRPPRKHGPPLPCPAGFRVMFAGNIGAAQSIETLLAAAEILRGHEDIHWIVVGDGRLAPWLGRKWRARAGRPGPSGGAIPAGGHAGVVCPGRPDVCEPAPGSGVCADHPPKSSPTWPAQNPSSPPWTAKGPASSTSPARAWRCPPKTPRGLPRLC